MAQKSIQSLREQVANSEKRFLEGPRSRMREFLFAFKVFREFIHAFRKLHFIGPSVTVFGSARFKEDHPYYIKARQLGAEISKLGFTVITGGGPGIMEAANRGAFEAGGQSIGCNIILPHEQRENPYVHESVEFNYFFVRKTLLLKYSYAFIIMPGGWGTMDEMFEALTLIQTGKIKQFPVILIGTSYWKNLIELTEDMIENKTISSDEIKEHLLFTDSVEDAMLHLRKFAIEKYGLKKMRRMKAKKWLGEFPFFRKK
jgi:uncharacterized protein (TIGR00730 family)